jgi:hypothetical protein
VKYEMRLLGPDESPEPKAIITHTHTTVIQPRFPWSRYPHRRLAQWLRGDDISWMQESWDLHRKFGSRYGAVKEIRDRHRRDFERAFLFGSDR